MTEMVKLWRLYDYIPTTSINNVKRKYINTSIFIGRRTYGCHCIADEVAADLSTQNRGGGVHDGGCIYLM